MAKGIKYDFVITQDEAKREKYHHLILVEGTDFDVCRKKVLNFFQHYQLVRYFQTDILKNESLAASSPDFEDKLKKSIQKNREILRNLINELEHEHVHTMQDLTELPQGYKSKILHVITHFLDGFFGIDTYFYNLIEDSHWITRKLEEKIKASPPHFWLISIEAGFERP